MLLLPFLVVSASLSVSHAWRHTIRFIPEISARAPARIEIAVSPPAARPQAPEQRLQSTIASLDAGPSSASDTDIEPKGVCLPDSRSALFAWSPRAARAARAEPPTIDDPAEFGLRLAAAARSQTEHFVVYTADYRSIAYPMGDIAPLFGACTDVVIRAYRALGIDLQELVHKARAGRGDPSIDHRRTETLRIFFARQGASLSVTAEAEDYRPGDLVTYRRPFGRVSQSHIAIVSDVSAPTGRLMIVHNRGSGPQLEDALFDGHITGHYRYLGRTIALAKSPENPAAPSQLRRARLKAVLSERSLPPPATGRRGSRIAASHVQPDAR